MRSDMLRLNDPQGECVGKLLRMRGGWIALSRDGTRWARDWIGPYPSKKEAAEAISLRLTTKRAEKAHAKG